MRAPSRNPAEDNEGDRGQQRDLSEQKLAGDRSRRESSR
jgi:hypothetical protein